MPTRFLAIAAAFLMCAQTARAASIDEDIDKYFAPFSDAFSRVVFFSISFGEAKIPLLILLLIIASIFCTIYLKGVGIWGFKHSIKQIFGKKASFNEPNSGKDGEVSSLGALATALSGTVGLGNIAGVAIAISVGGAGAMFWMCLGALFGMALKFCEVTLALKYRRFNADGSVSGGPMFYIAHGLTRRGLRWLGQPLALFFALMCVPGALGGGCMMQINQATQQMINITGGENGFFGVHSWVFGLIVAITVGLVIVGGIKAIANVTSKVVPVMCGLYIISALLIILINFQHIPHCIYTIIHEAFFPNAVAGGVIGTIIMGMRRSIQSNEAGSGSAPIAYAAVKTKEPVSQGFVSLIEPFFDTVLVCSMTALVIIITGQYLNYTDGMTGVQMTSAAFASVFSFFPYILAIVIILFAISTIISWAYYGQKAWGYLFGEGFKRTKAYQFMFCAFIVIGSSMNLNSVVDFTDATMLAMALPNLIAIFIMINEIKNDVILYCKKHGVKTWLKENV
ncbi:MAG: alanine:cation symporter family protein [Candidatus Gastranaerophilales bacterium]|nr:alanine:cation symporter family protein [Candidatus Gastranaerophilales bacterium]